MLLCPQSLPFVARFGKSRYGVCDMICQIALRQCQSEASVRPLVARFGKSRYGVCDAIWQIALRQCQGEGLGKMDWLSAAEVLDLVATACAAGDKERFRCGRADGGQ